MHEGAVCREILDIAVKAALENDITRITRITLVTGVNSCLHESELTFYFNLAKKATLAENAELIIEKDESLLGYRDDYVRDIEGD